MRLQYLIAAAHCLSYSCETHKDMGMPVTSATVRHEKLARICHNNTAGLSPSGDNSRRAYPRGNISGGNFSDHGHENYDGIKAGDSDGAEKNVDGGVASGRRASITNPPS